MALLRIETRRVVNGLLSFAVLAALLALFFQYRRAGYMLAAPQLSVNITHLPYYAFCSFSRMLLAYILSLAFALGYGLLAAKSHAYERFLIPAIDVAQAVPVIGFFPAAIYFFVALAHGSRAGVELAAIFLIFTSQAWNMALGVFESAKTIPSDLIEATQSFGVSGWFKFRWLLLPASITKLVYNSILSWVAGWYFLIACEIITVGPAHYRLPGLGSFLMESADKGREGELIAGLLVLLGIIITMDLLVWRPLSVWAEKFRYEFAASGQTMHSAMNVQLVARLSGRMVPLLRAGLSPLARWVGRFESVLHQSTGAARTILAPFWKRAGALLLAAVLIMCVWALVAGFVALARALAHPWPAEAALIPLATVVSLGRLLLAYLISLAWTLPFALAASDWPRFNRWLTSMAEIAGSLPATALFPLIVILVVNVTGGMNLASILLILTGMQWYLLFNLLGAIRQIPEDLKEAVRSFGLGRVRRWQKLVAPAMLPSLVTGSITAWGGGWNALILSEYFVYQGTHYKVFGIGALLDEATYATGNGTMILLSLLAMVLAVMGLNRLVWRPLYAYTTERFRIDY